jgi:hypothetical protein
MDVTLSIPEDNPRAVAVVTAIHGGDIAHLQRLLDENGSLASARVVDGRGVARTLLHIAADWPGHFPNGAPAVALLVASGADVDAPVLGVATHSETALHWAASSDDVDVLDALLDADADIEAPGAVFTGGTAMSDAVVFAQWRAARRLLERGAATTIWQAAALGLIDRVKEHVAARPRPPLEALTNALWHACRGGQLAVAQYLLEQGADPAWIGHDKKTPLDVARESGNSDLVRRLETHKTG